MTGYCLDASALVTRYAEESGSAWVLHITDTPAQHTILLAEITLAEVGAAMAAKQRAPGGSRWRSGTGRSAASFRTVMNISYSPRLIGV